MALLTLWPWTISGLMSMVRLNELSLPKLAPVRETLLEREVQH